VINITSINEKKKLINEHAEGYINAPDQLTEKNKKGLLSLRSIQKDKDRLFLERV